MDIAPQGWATLPPHPASLLKTVGLSREAVSISA